MAAAVFPGVWSLLRHVALGHQLVAHDGQHVLKRCQLLGREPLLDARHHCVDVALHEAVVAVELVRQLQVVFPPVGVGVLLDDVPLADEAVDLIGRVGLRDAEKIRKLTDGRRVELVDDLDGERLHRAQRALALAHLRKQAAEKLQLELLVHALKILLQHRKLPPYFFDLHTFSYLFYTKAPEK